MAGCAPSMTSLASALPVIAPQKLELKAAVCNLNIRSANPSSTSTSLCIPVSLLWAPPTGWRAKPTLANARLVLFFFSLFPSKVFPLFLLVSFCTPLWAKEVLEMYHMSSWFLPQPSPWPRLAERKGGTRRTQTTFVCTERLRLASYELGSWLVVWFRPGPVF